MMQRYFFHLNYHRECVPDEEGIELPDLDAARSDASDTIREMAADALRAKRELALYSIHICSDSGQLLAEVHVAEALAEVIRTKFIEPPPSDHHV